MYVHILLCNQGLAEDQPMVIQQSHATASKIPILEA